MPNMNPPTQWRAELSSSSFSPSTMIEQQCSFSPGETVNGTSNDQLWLEVAKRYQQIIEKDIKLRYPSQPVVPIKIFQTDCSIPHLITNPLESTQFGKNHPLPPVGYQKQESLNLTARQKEIDSGPFPRIIDVFSLNPTLPAKYFQDNVAVRLTPVGLIAESVGRSGSLENVVPKQNAIPRHSFTRRAEKIQEKRNLVDYYKKCMQGDNIQINQRADILDYIDIKAGLNATKLGTLTEGKPHAIEIHDGCEFHDNSTKEEKACDREAMVIATKNDVPEQIYSDVNARGKGRKRKRRAIFGLRSKKRQFMGNLNTVKEKNQHELEDELIRDGTKIDKSLQVEGCSSLKDANTGSEDISTEEKSNSSEKQGQGKTKDSSIQSKQSDEKNTTISFASKTELKCADTIDSGENLEDTSVSSLHGYNIRQSKILELKEKLAKQEQEIRNLKQRKDFENVEMEDCASDARPVEDNGSALLKYETIFDLSHPIDVTFSAQNEENDDDLNLDKIEDLIDTFQKEIKSFRILDTELFPTARHSDYDHLKTKTYLVGGNNKRVFTGVNNQMRLADDFASKEEFLFQLGLRRI